MRKLIPLLFAVIGIGIGIAAGLFLAPAGHPQEQAEASADTEDAANQATEFVKLNNQFVVTVLDKDEIDALVIVALSVEVPTGTNENVFSLEPKLRDVFLQVLLDHANIGGFGGEFTSGEKMAVLKTALLEGAQKVLGPDVVSILITEIARQDA